jgi:hypothetical protein
LNGSRRRRLAGKCKRKNFSERQHERGAAERLEK